MMLIKKYTLYERGTGMTHTIEITYAFDRYEVRHNGEFYATAENMAQAGFEAADIVIYNNLSNIRPL